MWIATDIGVMLGYDWCHAWSISAQLGVLGGFSVNGTLGMEGSSPSGVCLYGQAWCHVSYKVRDNIECMNCTGIDAGVSGDGLTREAFSFDN